MAFQQFNISPWLSAVRLVATSNQSGTYYNGPTNNGVNATFTYATGALTIDSVAVLVGDRVLLAGQTAANQNGVYVCTQAGATGVSAILQRSADQQCIEQLHIGQYVSVGAGTVNGGSAFVLVEPLPAHLGVDNLSWISQIAAGTGTAAAKDASDNAQPTVSSVVGATAANALAVFADTAGSVKAQTVASTLGFGLTITTGNFAVSAGTITSSGAIQSTAGNVTAGSSGNPGTLISFPTTAANGSLIVAAVNAGGAFNTTISSGTMGQSTVYTLPDILAATGGIVVSTAAVRMKSVAAAAAAGGAAAQSFTDTFCTTGSNVIGNWNTQANAASVLKIVPGNGSFVVTSSADAGVGTFNYVIMK